MQIESRECYRCGGEMDMGFIGDAGHFPDSIRQPRWDGGVPRPRWGFRLHKTLKVGAGPALAVLTARCQACGTLESIAPDAT